MTSSRGALIHEWLAHHGGSENVFDVFAEALPDADLWCLWSDVKDRYGDRTLNETWLARSPLRHSKPAALPFTLPTWRLLPGDYDWALISSHLFAHHAKFRGAGPDFAKLVYVHSPARYIWVPDLDHRGSHYLARAIAKPLKLIDRHRAKEPVAIAANSAYVARRIEECWERESTVIHPPVEVDRIAEVLAAGEPPDAADREILQDLPEQFVLGASRLIPYKRLDLVIRTAEELDVPAVIAGSGPELENLQAMAATAKVPVIFLGRPSSELLYFLYQRAMAFVFPPIEDFGIMPVEALAAGCPIVVGPEGGATEIVADSGAGAIAASRAPQDFARAVRSLGDVDPAVCRERAQLFSRQSFLDQIQGWLTSHVGEVEFNRS